MMRRSPPRAAPANFTVSASALSIGAQAAPKRASVPIGSTLSRDVGRAARLRLQRRQRFEIVPRRLEALHAAGKLHRRVVDERRRAASPPHHRRCAILMPVLAGPGDLQHDAVGAAFQLFEDDLVGGGGIGLDDALMDLPAEVLDVRLACRA